MNLDRKIFRSKLSDPSEILEEISQYSLEELEHSKKILKINSGLFKDFNTDASEKCTEVYNMVIAEIDRRGSLR